MVVVAFTFREEGDDCFDGRVSDIHLAFLVWSFLRSEIGRVRSEVFFVETKQIGARTMGPSPCYVSLLQGDLHRCEKLTVAIHVDEPSNDIGLMCTIEVKAVVTAEYLSGFGCHCGAAAQETESEVLSAGERCLTVPLKAG